MNSPTYRIFKSPKHILKLFALIERKECIDKEHMCGGTDRQPLCDALYDSDDDEFGPFKYCHFLSAFGNMVSSIAH